MADLLLEGTGRVLTESLTGLSKRQQLIAGNLANIDTPGYRAKDIQFEQALEKELRRDPYVLMAATSDRHLIPMDALGRPALMSEQGAFRSDGNGVDVDYQMSRLSETTIQFNSVAQLLAKRIGLLKTAVSEGRG